LAVSLQLFIQRRGWKQFRIFDPNGRRLLPGEPSSA
jgi:hypothetical protein